MGQVFKTINPTDLVSDSRLDINSNFSTLRSSFEGTDFPTSPVKGQLAYVNTILYIYDGAAWKRIWDENSDGNDFGLDADLLRGHTIDEFVLNTSDVSFPHRIKVTDNEVTLGQNGAITIGESNTYNISIDSDEIQTRYNGNVADLYLNFYGGNIKINSNISGANNSPLLIGSENYKVWHAGNDGSGSTLDADKLDGEEGSFYRDASNLNAGTVPTGRLSGTYSISISGNAATATKVNNSLIFNNSGTGAASGAAFDGSVAKTISYNTIGALSTSGGTITGNLTVKGNTTLGGASSDTITIKGATTLESNLTVQGNTTLGDSSTDTTTINGGVTLNNNLIVKGNTTLGDATTDTTTINGNLTLSNSLTVQGNTTLGDTSTDTTIINGNLTIDGGGTHSINSSIASGNIIDFKASNLTKASITTEGEFTGVSITAKYADLAEKYTVDGILDVGDVILISENENVDCEISNEIASYRVLGVISENPAFMMNSELKDGQYVALKGRVKCKVKGKVKKGDPLVSYLDGCAISIFNEEVKEKDLTGRIFAKALDSNNIDNVNIIEVVIL
jgi:hypothetical protein